MIVHVFGVLIMILLDNVIIFGVDNSSSSHSDNRKNIFLTLGEGPTLHKKWSFPFGISSVNVTKSVYWRNPWWKTSFFVQCNFGIRGSFRASEKKCLLLILVKRTENVVWVYIRTMIIVFCLLLEKKSLNLNLTMKTLTFQLNFVLEVFLD